ncbi:MAG TPA: hypothetical protein VGU20_13980 [Stellaceae bacterium]|nr:hypothetical protein [Stellaceae bacterium]
MQSDKVVILALIGVIALMASKTTSVSTLLKHGESDDEKKHDPAAADAAKKDQ